MGNTLIDTGTSGNTLCTPRIKSSKLLSPSPMLSLSRGIMSWIELMLGGALRAAGDARTPMRLGIVLTVLNLALNVVLIRGLGPIPAFGTRGAAMGTVIANAAVALAAFYLLFADRLVIRIPASAAAFLTAPPANEPAAVPRITSNRAATMFGR